MGKIAFLFPGQGSQSVGMGVSLGETFPHVRLLFDQANDILGFDLWAACQNGPEDRLKATDVAQPALYLTGYACAIVLQELGVRPEAVAGHSIGEYAALAVAGVFSFEAGLQLVRERGQLMHKAGEAAPGSMAAILGLSGDQVIALCEQAASNGVCAAVNFNSPEQTVIAGEQPALDEAARLAAAAGAKRIIPLNVSGAFHSPLMRPAAEAMKTVIARTTFHDPTVPVAMNASGALHRSAEAIRTTLNAQLDHPVRWVEDIRALIAEGCTVFVEAGSGRVLSGLLKRIDKSVEAFQTDSGETTSATAQALSAAQRRA